MSEPTTLRSLVDVPRESLQKENYKRNVVQRVVNEDAWDLYPGEPRRFACEAVRSGNVFEYLHTLLRPDTEYDDFIYIHESTLNTIFDTYNSVKNDEENKYLDEYEIRELSVATTLLELTMENQYE